MEYEGLNRALLMQISAPPRRVLDLGCGVGNLGKFIKEKWGAEVSGVTYSKGEAEKARQWYKKVEIADLNGWVPDRLEKFDLVICSHVLEHVYEPHQLLQKIRPILDADGILLVALPNVLFWRQRLQFLIGRFRYTEGGLMDSTHFRFFDYQTAQELIGASGYDSVTVRPDGVVPIGPLRRWIPKAFVEKIDEWGLRHFPGLFGWQILIVAKNKEK